MKVLYFAHLLLVAVLCGGCVDPPRRCLRSHTESAFEPQIWLGMTGLAGEVPAYPTGCGCVRQVVVCDEWAKK